MFPVPAVNILFVYYIDAGTYESGCMYVSSNYMRYRAIVRCDSNGNINELIYYESTFYTNACTQLLVEGSIVYSVTRDVYYPGTTIVCN